MEHGKFPRDLSTKSLTQPPRPVSESRTDQPIQTPPRLVSDQLINIFFQEWAPLYPVVHRPTILKAYEQYLNSVESLQSSPRDLTQLNLIFGIASLASIVSNRANLDFVAAMWCLIPFLSREPTRTPSFSRETGHLPSSRSRLTSLCPLSNALSLPKFIA